MEPGAILHGLAELIFPPRCVNCRRLGSHFCRRCRDQATLIGDDICVRCGNPTTRRCTCHECQQAPSDPLRGMRGVVFYGGPMAFAIQGFKYQGHKALSRPLAAFLTSYLQTHALSFDTLVPVPLHPDRLAFRGYNQSELLAQEVARASRLPVRTDLIYRARHTQPQATLNRRQRLENVRDAFLPVQPGLLHGERVLLIDDVCTTGSTLKACAQALHEAGAGEIWALAVARARPKTPPEPWQRGLSPAEVFAGWDEGRRPGGGEGQ
ncbi:MAG: ComF family protein [Caldilineales bacterium]|nr:ComF family protein [Caldilineales bacterium]MCW5859819.1 ComF family protein [Caldilineales bacterium]